jgi:DnaJ-domain-containing protein 1
MNLADSDLIIIGVCAVIGFVIVWFALSLPRRRDHVGRDDRGSTDGAGDARRRSDQPQEWYQVLEVSQGASIDEIRGAYRKKMMQYHPDRVEALGPEFKRLAESRTREINQAYERACKLRG